jgi:hypothetical protein
MLLPWLHRTQRTTRAANKAQHDAYSTPFEKFSLSARYDTTPMSYQSISPGFSLGEYAHTTGKFLSFNTQGLKSEETFKSCQSTQTTRPAARRRGGNEKKGRADRMPPQAATVRSIDTRARPYRHNRASPFLRMAQQEKEAAVSEPIKRRKSPPAYDRMNRGAPRHGSRSDPRPCSSRVCGAASDGRPGREKSLASLQGHSPAFPVAC